MIQDILPRKFDNQYHAYTPEPEDTVLVYHKGQILVKRLDDGTILYPSFEELGNEHADAVYFFSIDGERFFNVRYVNVKVPVGYTLEDPRIFRSSTPRYYAFAGVTGLHLYRWYREHSFCGKCSSAMVRDTKERMMKCPHCGNMVYPTISPAVIVGVVDGDRILMTKYAGGNYRNYALVAGFAEIGEGIEDTVRREVAEETGVNVGKIKFYKSQPWAFSGTLLFGFWAQLDGEAHIRLQEDELSEAVFMRADEIPESTDNQVSLTWEMIEKFREGYDPFAEN